MVDVRIVNAKFHVDSNGKMKITGMSEKGYPVEVSINKNNPVVFLYVSNQYFRFQTAAKKTHYFVYYNEVDVNCPGCPTRRLHWTGDNMASPTSMLFFLHDLIAEVLHYSFMKRYFDKDTKLEVDYLKERYKECSNYISDLSFEIITDELLSRFGDIGVDK